MDALQGHTFRDAPDQVIWRVGSLTSFTVRSQYRLIQPLQPQDKAAKFFWKAKASLKVKITTWLAVHERLPTDLYLQRRYIQPPSHCVFYDNHPESSTHIFLSCHFAKRVWSQLCTDWLFLRGPLPVGNYGRIGEYLLFLVCIGRHGILVLRQHPSGLSATLEFLNKINFLRKKFQIGQSSTQIFGANYLCNFVFFFSYVFLVSLVVLSLPKLAWWGRIFLCCTVSFLIYSDRTIFGLVIFSKKIIVIYLRS